MKGNKSGSKFKDFFFYSVCLPEILIFCPDVHIKPKLFLFTVLIYFSEDQMVTNCIYRQIYENFISFSLTKCNYVLSVFATYEQSNNF